MTGTPYRIIRSGRRTAAIEVSRSLVVTVRAPYLMSDAKIAEFVKTNERWIEKAIEKQRIKAENDLPSPDSEEIDALKTKAKEILPGKIKYYSELTGLCPVSVKVTGAKTRFGSCSGKNAVCFSYLLMRYPDKAVDYVVLHELCHIKHHDHSKRFWALVEKYMPDYKERRSLLK